MPDRIRGQSPDENTKRRTCHGQSDPGLRNTPEVKLAPISLPSEETADRIRRTTATNLAIGRFVVHRRF